MIREDKTEQEKVRKTIWKGYVFNRKSVLTGIDFNREKIQYGKVVHITETGSQF